MPKDEKTAICRAAEEKLSFIVRQINLHKSNEINVGVKTEASLDLINDSVSDYIIDLVKKKHLTDIELIARFVYIELSKYLYYDISYSKITDPSMRKIIVDTPIDVKNAKIFSYVVCTQWVQLYSYILSQFGIDVKIMRREGEDHAWGEVQLNNGNIIIVDATDYIMGSIDLSNAKSVNPTIGFLIVPDIFSGVKLQEVFNDIRFRSVRDELIPYYEANKDLDISLGYIDESGYLSDLIISENELFKKTDWIIRNEKEASAYIEKVKGFFSDLSIPNNIDGYEIYAYYHRFIKKLPINIRGRISMKTIFADSFSYKQARLRRKALKTPDDYLIYLKDLLYDRYYELLRDDDRESLKQFILLMKNGEAEKFSEAMLNVELKVSEINRRLNPYYAINELLIQNNFNSNDSSLFFIYEPGIGRKKFKSFDDAIQFKKVNNIIN